MTRERKLRERGYRFTGIYSEDRQEAKRRAAELRKKGKLACVLHKVYQGRVTASDGYSVYAREK